jgi:hypothetical protein
MIVALRILWVVFCLVLWHFTQKLLSRRNVSAGAAMPAAIADGIHQLTARHHRYLLDHPGVARQLLIFSSLMIDLLGMYLILSAVFGKTFEPFLGLMMVFALRQICQSFCPLPPPEGMIWRDPGVPSLLVTYGTSCDLFFSGHTAIAVYGAVTLGSTLGGVGMAIGVLIAAFEITAVLLLRAHYTMDVFTGAIAALWAHDMAVKISPYFDGWIGHLAR